MSNPLILFYSFEGNTRKVVKFISKELDIPYEELKPIKDLSSKGFSKYIWGGTQVVMGKKPELETLKMDLEEYETIIIASPIWAGTFAPAIKTLLETGILKNKKIAYLYCHDGGPGKAAVKGQRSIETHNEFISSLEMVRVKDDFEKIKYQALDWVRNIIK